MTHSDNKNHGKAYSYKTRKDRIRLRIIDSMDSICKAKGKDSQSKAKYYDTYDFSKTDPQGSYTGITNDNDYQVPVQDADDL